MKIIKQIGDHKEFSMAEAVSNENGKTSLSGIITAVTVGIGILLLLIGAIYYMVTKDATLLTQGAGTTTVGSGGAAVRKIMNGKPALEDAVVDDGGDTMGKADFSDEG